MLIKYFDLGMQLFCVIALLSECFCLVYHFMGVGGGGGGGGSLSIRTVRVLPLVLTQTCHGCSQMSVFTSLCQDFCQYQWSVSHSLKLTCSCLNVWGHSTSVYSCMCWKRAACVKSHLNLGGEWKTGKVTGKVMCLLSYIIMYCTFCIHRDCMNVLHDPSD